MRKTGTCSKCDKEISLSNYKRHYDSCKGPKHSKYDDWKIGDNLYRHPDGYVGNMAQVKCHVMNQSPRIYKENNNLAQYHLEIKSGKRTVWNKGKTLVTNPELCDKLRSGGIVTGRKIQSGELENHLSKWVQSEEGRKHKSEWRKELHLTNPETHPNRRLANNRGKMTYPERLIYDLLTDKGIEFEHQKKVDRYYPDFTIGKIIIEIDGEVFHNADKDAARDKILESHGYKVYRFPVGRKRDLVERVSEFLIEHSIKKAED